MNSIGPHFYALDPASQAWRIIVFCEAIWAHNDVSTSRFAQIIRSSLRSMAPDNRFPGVVRAHFDRIEIECSGYTIVSSLEASYVAARAFLEVAISSLLEEDKAP